MFDKLKRKFKKLSPTEQGFLIIIAVCIIGIIIRWDHILESVKASFEYFK